MKDENLAIKSNKVLNSLGEKHTEKEMIDAVSMVTGKTRDEITEEMRISESMNKVVAESSKFFKSLGNFNVEKTVSWSANLLCAMLTGYSPQMRLTIVMVLLESLEQNTDDKLLNSTNQMKKFLEDDDDGKGN